MCTRVIVTYVAAGCTAVRMIFAFVGICKKKYKIKEEAGMLRVSNCKGYTFTLESNWELFWPIFELIASAGSTFMLALIAFNFQCFVQNQGGSIIPSSAPDSGL